MSANAPAFHLVHNYWFIKYYKGIAKASTFISNVDNCTEASANDRTLWKAQARALRAYYYFMLFRSYGPIVMLGDEAIPLDADLEDLLKERNSVDECVNWIADEFDKAAADLPTKYEGANLGRFDKGACKAFKAKLLLYAASPLFNCNADYAGVVNTDGKQVCALQSGSRIEAGKFENTVLYVEKESILNVNAHFCFPVEGLAQGAANLYLNGELMATVQTGGTGERFLTQRMCRVKFMPGYYELKAEYVTPELKLDWIELE